MSHKHHDYTKHSKPRTTPEEVSETISEEFEDETVEIEEVVEETKLVIGVVTDCIKLNVRQEPSRDAEIIDKILVGTVVQVDTSESTEDFYKIYTSMGVEGYCVKEYININS